MTLPTLARSTISAPRFAIPVSKSALIPGQHLQCDALHALKCAQWDVLIAHPVCTYLTNSAEWAYKDADFTRYPGVGYHQRVKPGTLTGAARRTARADAVAFVLALAASGIPRICIENPIGYLSRVLTLPRQTVQPHQFGGESYIANCGADCRDKTDASAYDEAVSRRDIITMGKVIAEPLISAPEWPNRA